ncbi:hypothetical protein [Paraburkholderia youngii]|uniref:hypothetical protein n=1 Tax=Paraburkholderia youngii TaxID=2782701 RepID=UPI003D21DDA6
MALYACEVLFSPRIVDGPNTFEHKRSMGRLRREFTYAEAGNQFTQEQRARYRTDGAVICDIALAASDDLVRNLGGSLMPVGPVERYFRNLHAMASHFPMQVNPSAELFGRVLLGLPLPANARI